MQKTKIIRVVVGSNDQIIQEKYSWRYLMHHDIIYLRYDNKTIRIGWVTIQKKKSLDSHLSFENEAEIIMYHMLWCKNNTYCSLRV